jgi:regulator of protease activity HflC (stomatin/prohibitin superfamily)
MNEKNNGSMVMEEIKAPAVNGMGFLIGNTLAILGFIALFIASLAGIVSADEAGETIPAIYWVLMSVSIFFGFIICPILYSGLKVIKRNEALVLTLFGKYYGTLKGEGFYFVNPFVQAVPPASSSTTSGNLAADPTLVISKAAGNKEGAELAAAMKLLGNKKISLKSMTLNNDKQKINDSLGNPIIIGIVVVWRVVNTAKAIFNVDNYTEFLSIQCDSALRNIVRLYPYDSSEADQETSLRGSSQEIAEKLKSEIQSKIDVAGLEITEARITHLAYAPEIAAAMLQRQQASAIVDARQMIVDGAVGMVEMALNRLSENNVVNLDEERKAAMVSNLLVVLCGNQDAQPVVNSGSLY